MLRFTVLLAAFAVVSSQYPYDRAPQPPQREASLDEEYAPSPPVARSASRAPMRSPQNLVYRPADVHYVNIGAELAGDYKFGYDTGKADDGQSFREETRLPDGTVKGAYGYVDETGVQRIVRYTAGKEGFKVEGDNAKENAPKRSRPAASQPAPAPPQPAYAPPPQPAYQPPQQQPSYRPAPAQQAYRSAPAQPAYRPAPAQPAYRPAPAQPAYRPEPAQPAYRAPPQADYSPPAENYAPRSRSQSHSPRSRPQRPSRPAPPPRSYDYDYDDPNNEIGERRLAPIDTSLLSYNIGASQ